MVREIEKGAKRKTTKKKTSQGPKTLEGSPEEKFEEFAEEQPVVREIQKGKPVRGPSPEKRGGIPFGLYGFYMLDKLDAPEDVKALNLEGEYKEAVWRQFTGRPVKYHPEAEGVVGPRISYFELVYRKKFSRMSPQRKVEFASKYYGYKPPAAEEPNWADRLFGYFWMPHGQRTEAIQNQLFGTPKQKWWDDPFYKAVDTSAITYKNLIRQGDWGNVGLMMASSTPSVMGTAFLTGVGTGYFEGTKFGQKSLFQVGFFEKPLGSGFYKYTKTVTPSNLTRGVIGAGFGITTAISGYEALQKKELNKWFFGMALTAPFITGLYKAGFRSGLGYVQRKGSLSEVTGLDRVKQQALYDAMDEASRLRDVSYQSKPFKLTSIERVDPITGQKVMDYYHTFRGKTFTRFGGSASSYAQMPRYSFRTPRDIDLLIYDKFWTMKYAGSLKQSHVVDVHAYKPGGYLGYGKSLLPSTKIYISDIGWIKALGLREQFFRKTISILPSQKNVTGYRWFKDLPDWESIGDVLSFQKGGGGLRAAMDRYLNPSNYKIPKISIGERFTKLFGGAAQPKGWVETYGGMYIEPVYPKSMYPTYPTVLPINVGYPKGYDIPSKVSYNIPSVSIKPPRISYKPTVKTPAKMVFNPPKIVYDIRSPKPKIVYNVPSVNPPSIVISPYTPYIPTPPSSVIPGYPIPPSGTRGQRGYTKKTEDVGGMVIASDDQQGYNVLVKDRYIVKGKKKYQERFIKLNKNVLNRFDALSYGGTVTDNSAAASFKIVPTRGKPEKPSINVNPWSFIQNFFYKKDNIFIERNQHRINTSGEVREISARGWVAEKRKLTSKPKPILKKNNLKVLKMKDIRDMLKVRII